MTIIHLSTSDSGGAGEAAYSFHRRFLSAGFESILLVSDQRRAHSSNVIKAPRRKWLERKKRKFVNNHNDRKIVEGRQFFGLFSPLSSYYSEWLASFINEGTSAIFVHWVAGFISLEDILTALAGRSIPVYVVLMDMAPITGGCHYSFGCEAYSSGCQECPAVEGKRLKRLVKNRFEKESMLVKRLGAKAVCINDFSFSQAKISGMPFVDYLKVFPPVDTNVFKFLESGQGGMYEEVLFLGAYNPFDVRKGFEFLVTGLKILSERLAEEGKVLKLMVPDHGVHDSLKMPGFILSVYKFAKNKRDLASLYQNATLFLNTSEDDTGPLMVTQALFCGVPVIGSKVGILNEMLKYNPKLGISFDYGNANALSDSIYNALYGRNNLRPSKKIELSSKSYFEGYLPIESLQAK